MDKTYASFYTVYLIKYPCRNFNNDLAKPRRS